MTAPSHSPLIYDPSMEKPEPGEADTTEKLSHTLREILETTSIDYKHAVRSVHAKSHAILQGTLTVGEGLQPMLAQGLFAKPGSHKVILRVSTAPGDVLPDSISSPRGVAIKIFDVEGERVAGSENDTTQDIVLVDGPVFGVPDARHFAPQLSILAKTVDKAENLKKVVSTVLQALEGALETVGGKSAVLEGLGGRRNTNPLGDTYYSVTPFLYGKNIVKFSLLPTSENLKILKDKKIEVAGRADALREEIANVLRAGKATWDLRVQFCNNLDSMPIEDASKLWDEKESPFIPVARIEVDAQPGWNAERSKAVDDALAFDVWHSLKAHRPLGSINRVRRMVYPMSAGYRRQFNGCPMHEPKTVDLPK